MTTDNAPKRTTRSRRTTDEGAAPTPVLLKMADGTTEEAFNMNDSAAYVGVHPNVLQRLLDRDPNLTQYKTKLRSDRYLLKKDLDDLMVARPVDGSEGEEKDEE